MMKTGLSKDFENNLLAKIDEMSLSRKAIAKDPNSQICVYLQATSLNGFNYLEFTFISRILLKTMGGCKLTFKTKDNEYVLKSESDIIETDYATASKIGITIVDTDFDEEFDAFIKANIVEEIIINCKVGQIFKKAVSVNYTEIDMSAFRTSMVPIETISTGEISTPGGAIL